MLEIHYGTGTPCSRSADLKVLNLKVKKIILCVVHVLADNGLAWMKYAEGTLDVNLFPTEHCVLYWSLVQNYKHIFTEIDATIQDLFIYYFKISGETGARRGTF
jgi:hypothetical protein